MAGRGGGGGGGPKGQGGGSGRSLPPAAAADGSPPNPSVPRHPRDEYSGGGGGASNGALPVAVVGGPPQHLRSAAPQTAWADRSTLSQTAESAPAGGGGAQQHSQSAMSATIHSSNIRHHRQSGMKKRQQQQRPNPPPPPITPSIPDRLAATAITGTFEFLKLSAHAFPTVFGAVVAKLDATTPLRLKHWFRILNEAIQQLVRVLAATPSGRVFRYKFVELFRHLVGGASSDASRQVLVDSTSCLVKGFAALNTPEVHEFLRQSAVTGCRVLDALPQFRELAHDVPQLACSMAQLLDDPHTTVAVAQVAAYLLHALEMEHANGYRRSVQSKEQRREEAEKSSRRRRERSRRQQATYDDARAVLTDPNATVEQALLASILGPDVVVDQEDEDGASIPSNVFLDGDGGGDHEDDDHETDDRDKRRQQLHVDWDEQASLRQQVDSSQEGSSGQQRTPTRRRGDAGTADDHGVQEEGKPLEWHERARDDVDVALLREKIHRAASSSKRQHLQQPAPSAPAAAGAVDNDADVVPRTEGYVDVEDLAEARSPRPDHHRARARTALHLDQTGMDEELVGNVAPNQVPMESSSDDDDSDASVVADNTTKRKAGEGAVDHFYRVLDVCLEQQRTDTMKWVVEQEEQQQENGVEPRHGNVRKHPQSESLGIDNPVVSSSDTLKRQLDAFKAHFGSNVQPVVDGDASALYGVLKHRRLVLLVLAVALLTVLVFTSFACYGMYVFFRSSAPTVQAERQLPAKEMASSSSSSSGAAREVVIRVIREVVHVDINGQALDPSDVKHTAVSDEGIDDITRCVAESDEGVDDITRCVTEAI